MNQLYDQLPDAGKRLARIPRFGRLIAGIHPDLLKQIDSNAALFWILLSYVVSDNNDSTTGLIDSGLGATGAQTFGWRKTTEIKRTKRIRQWQVRLVLQMLGAIAFEMLCGKDGDGKSPPIYYVERKRASSFLNRVFKRIIAGGGYRNSIDDADDAMVDPDYLDQDWECLKHMNSVGLEYNIFSGTEREILFTDISMRDFLAAHWAVRWATPDDLQKTAFWIPDPIGNEPKSQYDDFWNYAVEIKTIRFDQGDDLLQPFDSGAWKKLFSPLYDIGQQPRPNAPIRSCQLIYRTWCAMDGSEAKQAFRSEFGDLVDRGDAIAKSVLVDPETAKSQFVRLADPDNPVDACDQGKFQMGAPVDEDPDWDGGDNPLHDVCLGPFAMNRFCVSNEQFERFAPSHEVNRESADEDRDVSKHPVVRVTWIDAWCFANWIGEFELGGSRYKVRLPTEGQWEYSCRCGESSPFTWHNRQDCDGIQSGQANFNGSHPWSSDSKSTESEAGIYLRRTIPVHGDDPQLQVAANPWGLHQMHGNVREWCWDWYDLESYKSDAPNATENPLGPATGTSRVLRGGCWFDFGRFLRSAYRNRLTPSFRYWDFGFRLAAVPERSK